MNIFDLQATIGLNADKLMSGLKDAQNSFSGLDDVASESASNMSDAFSRLEQPIAKVSPLLAEIADAAGEAASGVDDVGDSTSDAASGLTDVAGSASKAGGGLKEAGNAATSAGSDAEKSILKWELLRVALSAVVDVAKKVVSGLVDFGKDAVQTGMNFDAAMSNVQAISGATGEEFDSLRDKAKEMGASTKFTATEAADAFSYMAMAGWNAEQMMSGIEGVMNLAAASGEDLATTSDIVTDALTAFGLTAEDSAHFADVLAAASSAANTNVGMMGETFKYVAPVAGALGYSIEDVGTAIGLMANSGVKGSRAGTALRSALSNLLDPSDKVADALKDIGLMQLADDTGEFTYDMEALNKEVVAVNKATEDYNKTAEKYGANSEQAAKKATKLAEAQQKLNLAMEEQKRDALTYNAAILDSDGTMLSFADTVGKLRKAFSGLTEAEKAEYASVIFGQEAMAGMLAIINSTDADVYKLSDTVYNSSIDMDTLTSAVSDSGVEWDKYSDKAWTVNGLVDEMAYNFMQAGTSVEDFIEYLNSEYDMDLDDAISAVEAFQSAAEDSAGTAQRMADIMNDNLPGAVTIMQSAFDGLKIAVYEKIKGPLQDAAESAKDVFERLTEAVKTGGITEAFSEIGNIISEFASDKFGQLTEALGPVGDALEGLAGVVQNLAGAFQTAASSGIEAVSGSIQNFLDAFEDSSISSIIDDIATAAGNLFNDFLIAGESVINGIVNGIKKFFNIFDEGAAVDAIESVAGVIADLFSPFTAALGAAIKKAGEGLGNVAEKVGELAGHLANGVVDKIKDLADNFEKWAPWVAAVAAGFVTMQVLSTIVPLITTLKTVFIDLPSVTQLASSAMSALSGVLSSFGGPIGIAITAAVALTTALVTAYNTNEDFRDSVDAVLKTIADGVKAAFGAVSEFFTDTLPEAFRSFVDMLGDVANQIGAFFTETLPAKFDELVNILGGVVDKVKEVGRNIVEGIKQGILGAWDSMVSWFTSQCSSLVDSVLGFFGIHSPSTVFAGIGKNLVVGMEQGWGREFGTLERQVSRDLESLTGDAKKVSFADSALGRSSAAGISSLLAASDSGGSKDPVAVNLMLNGDTLATVLYDPIRRVAQQKGQNTREVAYA